LTADSAELYAKEGFNMLQRYFPIVANLQWIGKLRAITAWGSAGGR
jgi:hypothetical protein